MTVVAGSQPVTALQVEPFQKDNTRCQLILCCARHSSCSGLYLRKMKETT